MHEEAATEQLWLYNVKKKKIIKKNILECQPMHYTVYLNQAVDSLFELTTILKKQVLSS